MGLAHVHLKLCFENRHKNECGILFGFQMGLRGSRKRRSEFVRFVFPGTKEAHVGSAKGVLRQDEGAGVL